MNRINPKGTIQRVLVIIALVVVAHAVRPFTVRDVTRQMFRTTQSFSFVLPGVAVCTMEQADYLAAVLGGGFGDPTGISGQMRPEAELALASSMTDFNPEHDVFLSEVTQGSVPCPGTARREAQKNLAVVAKSAPVSKVSATRNQVAAIERADNAGDLTADFNEISLPRITSEAEESMAVVLPEVRQVEVPVIMRSDLAGVRDILSNLHRESQRNNCGSVLQDQESQAVLLPVRETPAALHPGSGRTGTETLQRLHALRVSIEIVPVVTDKRQQIRKIACTIDSRIVKC